MLHAARAAVRHGWTASAATGSGPARGRRKGAKETKE